MLECLPPVASAALWLLADVLEPLLAGPALWILKDVVDRPMLFVEPPLWSLENGLYQVAKTWNADVSLL